MTTTAEPSPTQAFTLRPFDPARDYPGVAALFSAHDNEFSGESNMTEERLRESHAAQLNFDPVESLQVAEAADGTLVGVMEVYTASPIPVRPSGFMATLPGWDDVILPLLDWGIEQAKTVFNRVPADARVVFQPAVHHKNERVAAGHVARGLTTDRCFYTMRIRFNGQHPPAPVFPDDIRVVTFADYPNVEAFATAVKVGFADHRGAAADTPMQYYIDRITTVMKESIFDPTVWWLALGENDTPAAVCNCFNEAEEFPNTAYVQQLAVVPAFRRKGLGLALLHHAFGEFYRRGLDGVSLGVDGASLTNAVALYERAGMSIAARYDAYELELRPGVEITKQ